MKRFKPSIVGLVASLFTAGAAHAAILVSYEGEAAGVESTTAAFSDANVESFNSLTPGIYRTPIVQTSTSGSASITMSYAGTNGVQINNADVYGGAGGNTNYIAAFAATPYTLSLSSTGVAGGVNYFGYWLSALDAGNEVLFYGSGGQLLLTFRPQDVLNVVTKKLNSGEYFGNPNAAYKGGNAAQPYIFLNFFDTTGSFSKIVFQEVPNDGGYESDNQTVGHYTSFGQGTFVPLASSIVGTVPEPGTWNMMLLGFGILGMATRAGRRTNPQDNRRASFAFA